MSLSDTVADAPSVPAPRNPEGQGRSRRREPRTYDYTRCGNPTRDQLAEAITTLEGGAGTTITASGMAAITNMLYVLVERGGKVVVPHDCYGGSWRLLDSLDKRGDIAMLTVDLTDVDLSDVDEPIRTRIDHGVGALNVLVPRSADVIVRLEQGVGDGGA